MLRGSSAPAQVLVDPRLLVGVGVLLVVLVVAAVLLSSAARRLDRLHRRTDGARAALDSQLLRRAVAAEQLALSGLLDPASSVLLAASAAEATAEGEWRDAGEELTLPGPERLDGDRERAESDLSAALRAALDVEATAALRADPRAVPYLAALAASSHRCALARRFYNDTVTQVRRIRRGRVVRWARLAGHAPEPWTFEVDDRPAAGLRV